MSYYHFNRKEVLQKAKERYSTEKAAKYCLKKQRSNKRKVKGLIQKLVRRRKRQDYRVPKKKISATDSVQKRNITK